MMTRATKLIDQLLEGSLNESELQTLQTCLDRADIVVNRAISLAKDRKLKAQLANMSAEISSMKHDIANIHSRAKNLAKSLQYVKGSVDRGFETELTSLIAAAKL